MAAVEHHAKHAKTKEKANQKSKTKIFTCCADKKGEQWV